MVVLLGASHNYEIHVGSPDALPMFEEVVYLRAGLYCFHDRRLHGKALAPLGTTTGQHSAAALGGHTSTETMALCALARIRLIGAFHDKTLSNSQK